MYNRIKTILIRNSIYDGDGDCAFIRVTEEVYCEVMGEDRYKDELNWKLKDIEWARTELEDEENRPEMNENTLSYCRAELKRAISRRNHWSLYLDDLFLALGIDRKTEKADLTIRNQKRRLNAYLILV